MVAESMVIFGPMSQVGWASASSTVTCRSCSERPGAERPAAGGEHHAGDLFAPAALHRLEQGAVFAIDRQKLARRIREHFADERPAHHQRFFVGQRHGLPRFERRQHAAESRAADDAGEHDINMFTPHRLQQAVGAGHQLDILRQTLPVEGISRLAIGRDDHFRQDALGLLDELLEPRMGGEHGSGQSPLAGGDHLDAALPHAARGAQHSNFARRGHEEGVRDWGLGVRDSMRRKRRGHLLSGPKT